MKIVLIPWLYATGLAFLCSFLAVIHGQFRMSCIFRASMYLNYMIMLRSWFLVYVKKNKSFPMKEEREMATKG